MFKLLAPDIAVAAQIGVDDVAHARDAGFAAIVCNRPDGEDAGQVDAAVIAAAATAAGLRFAHIPVDARGIDDGLVAAMAAVIGAGGKVLAYCRSGTRSTNLWALASASRGGDADVIIAAAARGGYDVAPMRGMLIRLAAG